MVALGIGAGLVVGALARMVRTRADRRRTAFGADGSRSSSTGLSDAELARIAGELDADDVSMSRSAELALRVAPASDAFADGSVVFVVTGPAEPDVWSIVRGGSRRRCGRSAGGSSPSSAEVHAPFAVMLQLLAGTLSLDDAIARSLDHHHR